MPGGPMPPWSSVRDFERSNVKRFRGGLAFKAGRLVHLGLIDLRVRADNRRPPRGGAHAWWPHALVEGEGVSHICQVVALAAHLCKAAVLVGIRSRPIMRGLIPASIPHEHDSSNLRTSTWQKYEAVPRRARF